MSQKGYLVLETGKIFEGKWMGGSSQAGEVVFNTSHTGYEEIATDPSYYSQIMVMTAPMMGNYGIDNSHCESDNIHIQGFIALEIQNSLKNNHWVKKLITSGVGVVEGMDTRSIVLYLRQRGTLWGALVSAKNENLAVAESKVLIAQKKAESKDWAWTVSNIPTKIQVGEKKTGPRVAVLNFGVKKSICQELLSRCSEIKIYPSRTMAKEIMDWNPDGIVLSNGPGDPCDVKDAVRTVQNVLGVRPIFGICMGHQILSLALGGSTYKLQFGHRGGNHPVKDELFNTIYMTSQNHGYAVKNHSFSSSDVHISHVNLYDKTVEGISCKSKKAMSVQFHPESSPGPQDAKCLFDLFTEGIL